MFDIEKCSEKEILIYEAFMRLMQSGNDMLSITTTEIAKEAGVGKGTLYLYFKNKDDIIIHAALYMLICETRYLSEAVSKCTTFYEKCDLLFDSAYEIGDKKCSLFNIIMTLRAHISDDIFLDLVKEYKDEATRQISSIMLKMINDGKKNGEINSRADDSYIMQTMLGACAALHLVLHEGYELDKLKENAHRMVSAAICADS